MHSLSKFGMQLCCVCGSILSVDDAECSQCNHIIKNQVINPRIKPKLVTQPDHDQPLLLSEITKYKYKK